MRRPPDVGGWWAVGVGVLVVFAFVGLLVAQDRQIRDEAREATARGAMADVLCGALERRTLEFLVRASRTQSAETRQADATLALAYAQSAAACRAHRWPDRKPEPGGRP